MKKLINFVREAKAELMKVNWPNREQTTNYTLIIIGVSIVVAIFLGGLDYLFAEVLKKII
jgi:preprotein translocase subunit SecE